MVDSNPVRSRIPMSDFSFKESSPHLGCTSGEYHRMLNERDIRLGRAISV